jgi:hypothetical protein
MPRQSNDRSVTPTLNDDLTWKSYELDCATKLSELESKSLELQETWGKFTEKLKLANRNDVATTTKPDINVVRLAIQEAETQMQQKSHSKVGKVKSFFSKSTQSLDNYNYLFDLLPSGDKYTSVFVGAFSTIVKVQYHFQLGQDRG